MVLGSYKLLISYDTWHTSSIRCPEKEIVCIERLQRETTCFVIDFQNHLAVESLLPLYIYSLDLGFLCGKLMITLCLHAHNQVCNFSPKQANQGFKYGYTGAKLTPETPESPVSRIFKDQSESQMYIQRLLKHQDSRNAPK